MVAIVTGGGLGLQNTSGFVLGSRGQLGQASLGRAGDQVYVNGANGNLVIQNTDEILIGLGPDNVIARTYNSRGTFNDDNGDNWRPSVARKVTGLTGTENTAGSTITLIDWDGSENVYVYDTTRGLYVFKEGAGAHDTLSFSSGTWTWQDGDSRIRDTFESHLAAGRITQSSDLDGNDLTFAYYDGAGENGLIKSVTTQNGEVTTFLYLAGTTKLEKITTSYTNLATSAVETITRVSYAYTSGRLTGVSVDLTPLNGADSVAYTTNYAYDAAGRVNQITQTDGSKLVVEYDASGRVTKLTQTVVAGTAPITRVTDIEYLTATSTRITDPAGQQTTLTYDAQGRMTGVTMPPAVSGGTAQVMAFTYDSDGNILSVNAGPSNVTTYEYESAWGGTNGNWTIQRDNAGNTVRRTYGANNELLTETLYTTPDPAPDETGVGQAAGPQTTRYAYDGENHLRFIVDGEGGVTEFTYLTNGLLSASVGYTASKYEISALAPTDTIATSALTAWVTALSDKSTIEKATYGYDARGNIVTGQAYGVTDAAGAGQTTDRTRVFYTHDQAGRMLTRRVDTSAVAETFVYDGLGRVVASTDYAGVATTVQFNDATTTTAVTLANGLIKTSVYNKAGELVSYMEAPTGVTAPDKKFRYDAVGRLRIVTDETGVSTHYLYDFVGRKVAEITADGALTEYGYNANDRLIKTVRYATPLTATQMASLADANGDPLAVDLATLRPAGVTADRWEWRIYDTAQRLIEVIDGAGYATIYAYDGASRLLSTMRHANPLSGSLITGYKTTPPTAKVTPSLNTDNDRLARNFYDAAGLLVGVMDAEGYLTQIIRDAAGQKIKTVGYATATAAANRASGSFATLLADVTASANPDDIETRFIYDGRGYLRALIDGEGALTRYNYSPLGYLTQEIRGQQMTAAQIQAFEALPRTIANLPAATAGVQLDTITWTRNNYGQVLTEVRALTSGSETVTYTYDQQRRLIKTATTGTGVDARTQNQRYDARGRLIWTLSGEGSVVLAALGATPEQAAVDAVYDDYGVFYAYDEAGRLVSRTTPNGDGTGRLRTLYYYDEAGNLTHTVNALGEVVEHRYNLFNQRSDTIVYATRLDVNAAAWALLKGGRVSQDANFTSLFAAVPNAAADSQTHIDYNVTGTVSQSFDALGYAAATQYKTTYTYNAFREMLTATAPIASGATVQTANVYDRRGLLLSSTVDPTGLNLKTSYQYDAFGRTRFVTDPNLLTREIRYDRAGQMVASIDALNQTTSYAYDGRGNVLTITDRNGKTTSFAYTAHGRQVTMTTAEGVVTTTKSSAYGQVLSITVDELPNTPDYGPSRVRTWTYNKDGELKTYNDGAGTETRAYDMAGRLKEVTDARGVKTAYGYDAANRVLTKTVDPTSLNPTGLNLTTTYEYDGKGQQWRITDPAGVVTQITFDKKGQKTLVAVDPAGLNLRTAYAYDRAGRVTTVTQGSGASPTRITLYTYDKADRLIKTQVNPSGLNLTTEYAYDKNGDLTARKDAAGAISRFVYDAGNRLIHAVDGAGGVVTHTYDAEGRVTSTRGYTNAISSATMADWATAGWNVAITAADVTGAVMTAANDHLTHFVYDGDGRLRFSVDANARPTEYLYDAAGNVVRSIAYAGTIASASSYSLAYVQGEIATKGLAGLAANQVTRAAYDGANRQVYGIDAEGRVTLYARDAAGNVINQRQYAALYTDSDNPTKAALDTWATTNANTTNDRISRLRYDNAGRLAYEVDALGYVTKYEYEEDGQIAARIRYAGVYTVTDTTTTTGLNSMVGATPPASAAVTRYTYDNAGRLTDITDPENFVTHLVLDVLGQATQTIRAFGTTTDASTTQRVYDAAGRVTSQTVAYGVSGVATTTTYTYDGVGRMLTSTVGGAVTTRTYDGAGRLASETRGSGVTEASTTSYGYDGTGQQVTATDGRLTTTTRTYDALGNITKVTTPLDTGVTAEVFNEYDLFGNLVKVTDPRGGVGYFYYDALNRLVKQANPLGYVTETTYTMGGEVASVTVYDNLFTGLSVTNKPNTTGQPGSTTTFARDKLDRLTGVTDAMLATETYQLDAFGNRTQVTNKLGGVTDNTYDKRGLLTQELKTVRWSSAVDATPGTSPDSSQTIVNKYKYDGRGNLIETLEGLDSATAPDTAALRKTTYGYDKADRLTSKAGDAVTIVNSSTNLSATATVTPTETYKYDSRGNLTEVVDPTGARTLYSYDALGRRTGEINAVGTMRKWAYDANGNVISAKVFDTAVTLPASGAAWPAEPASFRETLYAYDLGNRLIETKVVDLRTGAWDVALNPDAYNTVVDDVVTSRVYDKNGNVVKETDGAGASTYHFYDAAGREIVKIDAEKYMTLYTRDAEGNVTKEERFANKVTASFDETTDLKTASVLNSVKPAANTAADRITEFTYDRNGLRLTEKRRNVNYWTVSTSTGAPTETTAGDVTIAYQYNALGQVTQKKETNLDTTDYTYDNFGRQITMLEAAFIDYNNANVRLLTEHSYDRLNNLTQTRQMKATVGTTPAYSSTSDRITTYTYVKGRLEKVTDAENFERRYGYDKAGRVVKEEYDRIKSDGVAANAVTEASAWRYDAVGRVIFEAKAAYDDVAGQWSFGERTHYRYNAHGEITGKGISGTDTAPSTYQETFDYDAGGRMWRSTGGDGTVKIYLYDGAGNATLTVGTSGRDNAAETVDSIVALLTNNNDPTKKIGDVNVTGVTITIATYDGRGQQTATRQPYSELSYVGTTTSFNYATIVKSRTYNAFGEVASETDPRNVGYVTDYKYNTMGRLIEKKSPTVSVTGENGASSNVRPTETYYYDKAGRLVGVKDANNNVITRELLAGSGHGGTEAKVVTEFHPDAGKLKTAYDVFGDAWKLTNEENAVEDRTYDKMGRVLTIARPQRTDGVRLTEYYSYDGLGQRLAHWNSQLKVGSVATKETTDYDLQGRVIKTVGFANSATDGGDVTTFAYTWSDGLTTSGLGTFGGWTKLTTVAAKKSDGTNRTSTEVTDYFGRLIDKIDLGGHNFNFTYNKAGRLTNQNSGSGGQKIDYVWFNTGLIATTTDSSGVNGATQRNVAGKYGYDEAGNRTQEVYTSANYAYSSTGVLTTNTPQTHQNATVTYDAMNRMTKFADTGASAGNLVEVNYSYDAKGNTRRIKTDVTPTGGTLSNKQDYWYRYDSMDRFVTAMGTLSGTAGAAGTTVVRAANGVYTGVDLLYDKAGQRVSETRTYQEQVFDWNTFQYVWVDQDSVTGYTYTADGFLQSTLWGSGSSAVRTRDAMGRVTLYDENGATRTVTYNNKSQVTRELEIFPNGASNHNRYETLYSYTTNGRYQGGLVTQVTVDRAVLRNSDGGVSFEMADSQTDYTYEWWDQGLKTYEVLDSNTDSTASTDINTTDLTYNQSGQLISVYFDEETQHTTTYVNDFQGQVLKRGESTDAVFYYLGGQRIGQMTVSGTALSGFSFDRAYQSVGWRLDPQPGTSDTARSYTVRAGDTFQTLAQLFWGDAALWWMIADFNGMTSDTELAAGMTIRIPNMVANVHQSATTFKPYDPNKAVGTTSPTKPKQPAPPPPAEHPGDGCSAAQIIVTIVAVAVTVVTFGALTGPTTGVLGSMAAGAAAGAAGSVAGQLTGMALGVQDQFSWKSVALAALGGAVGGGIKAQFGAPTTFVEGLLQGAAGNAITQGVAVATGLQERFDWTAVAIGGIVGGVGAEVGHYLDVKSGFPAAFSGQGIANNIVTGMAAGIAGAAARTLIDGSDFGDNLAAVLPDVIGVTIGNAIAGGILAKAAAKGPSTASRLEENNYPYLYEEDGQGNVILVKDSNGNPIRRDGQPYDAADVQSGANPDLSLSVLAEDGPTGVWRTRTVNDWNELTTEDLGDALEFYSDGSASGVVHSTWEADSAGEAIIHSFTMKGDSRTFLWVDSGQDSGHIPGLGLQIHRASPSSGTPFTYGDSGARLSAAPGGLFGPFGIFGNFTQRATEARIAFDQGQRILDQRSVMNTRWQNFKLGALGYATQFGAATDGLMVPITGTLDTVGGFGDGHIGLVSPEQRADTDFLVMLGELGTVAFSPAVTARSIAPAASEAGIFRTNSELVQDIATRADIWGARQGLYNGPVAGTLKHGYADRLLTRYQAIYGDRGLSTEVRYLNGDLWESGMSLNGSIRLDVVEGPVGNPVAVYDYKFGAAQLTTIRVQQIQSGANLPSGVSVVGVKPRWP